MSFIGKIKSRGRLYLVEVKNQREGGKIRQKFIRYVGIAPQDNKTLFPKDLSELTINGSRVFGSVIMLDFLARQIGLYDHLGEQAHPILTLVTATATRVCQKFKDGLKKQTSVRFLESLK